MTRESLRVFLRTTLAEIQGRPGWHVVRLPWRAPATLAGSRPPSVVFAPPAADGLVGYGEARTLADDDGSLDRIRSAAERHYAATRVHAHPALPAACRRPTPWVGGLRFHADVGGDPAWRDFPAAAFTIPRWAIGSLLATATLALTVEGAALTPDAIAELEREYLELEASKPPAAAAGPGGSQRPADEGGWLARAAAALAAIEAGRFEKLVLARHVDVELHAPLDAVRVLEALRGRFPACTLFHLARGQSELFGATPELLVRLHDGVVESDAVAGSADVAHASRLAASPKERHEHALVVDAIVGGLAPLCRTLERPPAPLAHRLANIVHLRTPIRATLRTPEHVLSLVERLHPTPAVGGVPTAAALAYLRAAEDAPRGWYAAPFGCFDERGEGHFVVALRSCVRHPGGLRAYAGAGLVRGSRPLDELEETRLKLRAVLDALDVAADQPASRVG
jgi:menaquinone-specific isochorismate synthase